jgi:hypothetical protein
MSQLKGLWVKREESTVGVEDGELTVKLKLDGGLSKSVSGIGVHESTITNEMLEDGAITENKLADAYLKSDGTSLITSDQDAGGFQVVDVESPVEMSDLATKYYVDNELQGLDFQQDIFGIQEDALFEPTLEAGTRYIITNSGLLHNNFGVIAGLENNDIVEYTGTEWIVAYDVSVQGEGAICWNRNSQFFNVFNGSAWIQFGGLSQVVAGVGVEKVDDDLILNVDETSIEIESDVAQLKALGITKTHLSADAVGNGLTGLNGDALLVTTGNGLEATTDVHLTQLESQWDINNRTVKNIKTPQSDKQITDFKTLKENLLFHFSEQVVLTADMIAQKAIELHYSPDHDSRSATDISVHTGPVLNHGHHFTISDNVLSWEGKAPENILSAGDVVIVSYFVDRVHHAIVIKWTAELVQRLGNEEYVLSLLLLSDGTILAGTQPNGQIWKSTDNGTSFNLVQRLGSEEYIYSLCSLSDGTILAGTAPNGQVWKSTDNGTSFNLVQRLGSETLIRCFSQLNDMSVLVGTYPTGQIWKLTRS